MTFDYKKEYKEYYLPKNKPVLVSIPTMNYIAINGHGDPNDEKGEYKDALSLLYSIAFTLKMSYKTDYHIEGYFSYVVPPLEGYGGKIIVILLIISIKKISIGYQ